MKNICKIVVLCVISIFNMTNFTQAQSNAFIIEGDYIQPARTVPHQNLGKVDAAMGIKLGYRINSFPKQNLSLILGGFFDLYGYQFLISNVNLDKSSVDTKNFNGATIFTGINIMPNYTFNPEDEWRFALGASLKIGNYFGWGNVYERNVYDDRQYLEKLKVNAGIGLAFAPKVSLMHPISNGAIGLQLGWESSDYGRGLRSLNSSSYKNINYQSSIFTFGLIAYFNFKNERK